MITPHPSDSTGPAAPRTTFTFKATVFSVALVISLAIVGWFFRTRADAAAQHAEYERLLKKLELGIDTIHYFQTHPQSPVEFMRAVGKLSSGTTDVEINSFASRDRRWLFRGRSRSVEATAHFLIFLQGSKTFSDVQLRKFYQDNGKNSPPYRFEFDCAYSPPATAGNTP
jgi:hypothetical protein